MLLAKIFGSKIYDEDFLELLFKFGIDLFFAFIIIRVIYFTVSKKSDLVFTFFLFNILIFFVCAMMSGVKLSMGFAFGLFAVFSILRYRTVPLPLREMTYLFIVITLAVINALANKKISIIELVFVNSAIVVATYILEKSLILKSEVSKTVIYEKIENITPANHQILMDDLKARTGMDIIRFEIGKIDFLKDTAVIKIYFNKDENSSNSDSSGYES